MKGQLTTSQKSETITIHKAESRGTFKNDWLHSKHTFSFGGYYNVERQNFGALRVINDDIVYGGMGFGSHPHENMEIISIPLEGELEHQDSMGNTTVIKQGDVQLMSAGTGVIHSEYNKNREKEVKFLQIWVQPNIKNSQPYYDQISLNVNDRTNQFQEIVAPQKSARNVDIQQNSWFHMGRFNKDFETEYHLKIKENGVYAFVIEGSFEINNQLLNRRDGMGIYNIESLKIISKSKHSELLLIEVPMN